MSKRPQQRIPVVTPATPMNQVRQMTNTLQAMIPTLLKICGSSKTFGSDLSLLATDLTPQRIASARRSLDDMNAGFEEISKLVDLHAAKQTGATQ